MPRGWTAGWFAALLATTGGPARAEVPDAATADGGATGEDSAPGRPDAANASLAPAPSTTAPAPTPSPEPGARPRPAALPPQRRDAERVGRDARGEWPLSYVDRPQLLLEGMDEVGLSTHGLFGPALQQPDGLVQIYRRSLVTAGYAVGLTDQMTFNVSLPRLLCSGQGWGTCRDGVSLWPQVGLSHALVEGERLKLKAGAALLLPFDRGSLSTRLKLVLPHWASLELEPALSIGFDSRQTAAWWAPRTTQDGNQTRLFLTIDANFQLTDHVLVWGDVVPYRPLGLSGPVTQAPINPAVEVGAGLALAFTKSLEVHLSYWKFNVLDARPWEYVPRVWELVVGITWRGFDGATRLPS